MKVAYIRVSTSSEDQANSFENQEAHFKEKGILKIYADKGISGTSLKNREGFIEMLKDCGLSVKEVKSGSHKKIIVMNSNKHSIIDTIYCKSITRFSRNVEEAISIIKTLADKKITLIFEQEGINTSQPTSELLLNILLTMSENESLEISKRVRWGNVETAKKGVCRSFRSYGYRYNKANKKMYIHEEEAKIVRRIFELRLEGNGVRVIANILKDEGYIARNGKPFSQSTILGILKNPIYAGYITRNRYDISTLRATRKCTQKSEDEWVQTYDEDLAIISIEVFNKCKELINSATISDKGIYKGKSELAGLIKCGNCGASYVRNINGGVYYNCYTKKKKGIKVCNNKNISQKKIDNMFNRLVGEGLFNHYQRMIGVIDRVADRYIKELNENFNNSDAKIIEDLETEKKILNDKLQKLLELYLDGAMNKEMLIAKKTELENRLNEVNADINKYNTPADVVKAKIDAINKIRETAHKEYSHIPKDITREQLIEDYIDSIKVSRNGNLIVRTNIVSYLQKIHGTCNEDSRISMTYTQSLE